MSYTDYIKGLGFLPSNLDDLKEYAANNGGSLTIINNNNEKELRLFFTKGKDKKINIRKEKKSFVCELRNETRKFTSFEALLNYIEKDT